MYRYGWVEPGGSQNSVAIKSSAIIRIESDTLLCTAALFVAIVEAMLPTSYGVEVTRMYEKVIKSIDDETTVYRFLTDNC